MDKKTKRKLVKRLYELANGAEPIADAKNYGILRDLFHCIGPGYIHAYDAVHYLDQQYKYVHAENSLVYSHRWNNEQRCLAGLLAAFIETDIY